MKPACIASTRSLTHHVCQYAMTLSSTQLLPRQEHFLSLVVLDGDGPAAIAVLQFPKRRYSSLRLDGLHQMHTTVGSRPLQQLDQSCALTGAKIAQCCGRNDHRIQTTFRRPLRPIGTECVHALGEASTCRGVQHTLEHVILFRDGG